MNRWRGGSNKAALRVKRDGRYYNVYIKTPMEPEIRSRIEAEIDQILESLGAPAGVGELQGGPVYETTFEGHTITLEEVFRAGDEPGREGSRG